MAVNLNSITPAIPTGGAAVTFQSDGAGNISAYTTAAPIAAFVNLTAQAAAITPATLFAVGSGGAGVYQISYVATITLVATTSCVLGGANGFQIVYTNFDDSVVKTSQPGVTNATNTTANSISGVLVAKVLASTTIQYSMGYTSVGGTPMQFDLNICAILL